MNQHSSPPARNGNARNGIGRLCAHCGQDIPVANGQGALIPDSTVIDFRDASLDGQRYVTACGAEHLQLLIDQAQHDWIDEQLWFGQLCRASTQPGMSGSLVTTLGEHARLSVDHLSRALTWNATSAEPRRTLPGGQIVPSQGHESATLPPAP